MQSSGTADPILIDKGVLVVPDVLANAGGPEQGFTTYVYRTTNPADNESWEETLRFTSSNRTRVS